MKPQTVSGSQDDRQSGDMAVREIMVVDTVEVRAACGTVSFRFAHIDAHTLTRVVPAEFGDAVFEQLRSATYDAEDAYPQMVPEELRLAQASRTDLARTMRAWHRGQAWGWEKALEFVVTEGVQAMTTLVHAGHVGLFADPPYASTRSLRSSTRGNSS